MRVGRRAVSWEGGVVGGEEGAAGGEQGAAGGEQALLVQPLQRLHMLLAVSAPCG